MNIIKKVIWIICLGFSLSACSLSACSLFTEAYYNSLYPDNTVLHTGENLAIWDDTVAIGSVSSGSSGGFITVVEKKEKKWKTVFTYEVSSLYRGPVTLDMNEKYIVAGLDAKQGRSGVVLVLKKVNGKWKKAYYIKSPKPDKDDLFGFSISLQGNKLLVGARNYNKTGAAFLFTLNEKKYVKEHIFIEKNENNASFGQTVIIAKDNYIISDSLYYYRYNSQFSDNYVSAINDDGKEILKAIYDENKKREGALYFYDKDTYETEKEIFNDDLEDEYSHSYLGDNGISDDNKILISDRTSLYLVDEEKFKLKKIWNENDKVLFSSHGQPSQNYGYTFYDDLFIINDGIYKLDGELKKLNTIKLKCNTGEDEHPLDVYCMRKDLLLCTDNNCDNFIQIKEQESLFLEERKRTGTPQQKIDLPINKGRVHFLRLFPDGSYEEEAIIARRTNSKGKIEFYDMLHD